MHTSLILTVIADDKPGIVEKIAEPSRPPGRTGNTGTFEARLRIPEGDLVLAMDRSISAVRSRIPGTARAGRCCCTSSAWR